MRRSIAASALSLCSLAALLLQGRVAGAEDSTLQHVVAEGVGRTTDEAQKDAWRNAVSLVVGTMVDTETLVRNDKLISDQVLTFGQGYIQRSSMLSQTESGGLYRVKIEAWVKKTEIKTKLTAIQVIRIEADGGSIAAEIETRQHLGRNASGIFLKAIAPFLSAQHIKVVRVTQGQIDVRADGASIEYLVELGIDDAIFQKLREGLVEVLETVARPMPQDVPPDTIRDAPHTFRDLARELVSFPHGSGYAKVARERAADVGVIIQNGGELSGYLLDRSFLPQTWIRALAGLMGVKVRVRLLDSRDAVVATSPWSCLPTPNALYPAVSGCPRWGIHNEEREIQGRVGEEFVGGDGSRLLIGITNLVSPYGRPSFRSTGVVGALIAVKLPVMLDGEQARRVVRAEAQVAPFPEIPQE